MVGDGEAIAVPEITVHANIYSIYNLICHHLLSLSLLWFILRFLLLSERSTGDTLLILVSVLLSVDKCKLPSWPPNLAHSCNTFVVLLVSVDAQRVSKLVSHQLLLLLIYYWGCGEEAVTQRRCVCECECLCTDRTDVLHDVSLMSEVLLILMLRARVSV